LALQEGLAPGFADQLGALAGDVGLVGVEVGALPREFRLADPRQDARRGRDLLAVGTRSPNSAISLPSSISAHMPTSAVDKAAFNSVAPVAAAE
jgi:hypothetical protein